VDRDRLLLSRRLAVVRPCGRWRPLRLLLSLPFLLLPLLELLLLLLVLQLQLLKLLLLFELSFLLLAIIGGVLL
jgi:hypothetical protein